MQMSIQHEPTCWRLIADSRLHAAASRGISQAQSQMGAQSLGVHATEAVYCEPPLLHLRRQAWHECAQVFASAKVKMPPSNGLQHGFCKPGMNQGKTTAHFLYAQLPPQLQTLLHGLRMLKLQSLHSAVAQRPNPISSPQAAMPSATTCCLLQPECGSTP